MAGLSFNDWLAQLGEPESQDKSARKGKAKGQKGQDETTDERAIEKGDEPQNLVTANEEVDLSDKMDAHSEASDEQP